jgi:hypothetical protein
MPSNKKSRNNEFLSKKFSNKFLKYYLFRILLYIFFSISHFRICFFDEKQKYICARLEINRQNYVSFHASLITKYYLICFNFKLNLNVCIILKEKNLTNETFLKTWTFDSIETFHIFFELHVLFPIKFIIIMLK